MREKKIFALGFFDGVHRGHQVLMRECVRMAKNVNRLEEYAVNKGNVVVFANVRKDKKNVQAYALRKMSVVLLAKTVSNVLKVYAWLNSLFEIFSSKTRIFSQTR